MESSLKIYSVCIYNIQADLTLLQMYFFHIKLLIICAIYKIRTTFILIPETKEMCYYHVMCFPFQNRKTNQIILDNTLKPSKTCIIVSKPGME